MNILTCYNKLLVVYFRALKEERNILIENNEQLELKQELDFNTSKNLNKRIEDLQVSYNC